MKERADNLLAAVSRAMGRTPDLGSTDDRLILQKGCFILNQWGYGPFYDYNLYVRGPFSDGLEEAYEAEDRIGTETDIPDVVIDRLSGIIARGAEYMDAYATLLMAISYNPKTPKDVIMRMVEEYRPSLVPSFREASLSLF